MEKSKKRWVDFEITRIRLEPEQAVLSCCDNVNKNQLPAQCFGNCPGNGSFSESS